MALLAANAVVQLVRQACADDDVHLSAKTELYLAAKGIRREAAISALAKHIDDGCKIHVKLYARGGQGYHGSLCLDPTGTATVYFEVKCSKDPNLCAVWMQIHDHTPGYIPLQR